MNFEINPLLYFTSEDEMADGLEKVAGEDFGSSEAQIVHALDDLAEALGTDGFGILERSGDGTRLGEAVQSALAALEALKRAEAEVPEGAKEIRSPNLLDRCHARRKHRVLRRQGNGRPKDTRADREASGLHVRGAHEGRCRRYRRRTRRGAGEARASCVRAEELTDEGADRA